MYALRTSSELRSSCAVPSWTTRPVWRGVEEFVRRSFVDYAACLEDVAAVGDFERLLHHLLDEQDCDAALAYLSDGLEHALDEARLESERKLVQKYEFRTRHKAARRTSAARRRSSSPPSARSGP